MNGQYFQNPTFPGAERLEPLTNSNEETLSMEQSFIENILRLNKKKMVKIHATFPDSNEWRDKIFEGILEEAGRDHIIVRNTKSGTWTLILMIYLNYVEFDEKVIYSHSYSEQTYS